MGKATRFGVIGGARVAQRQSAPERRGGDPATPAPGPERSGEAGGSIPPPRAPCPHPYVHTERIASDVPTGKNDEYYQSGVLRAYCVVCGEKLAESRDEWWKR